MEPDLPPPTGPDRPLPCRGAGDHRGTGPAWGASQISSSSSPEPAPSGAVGGRPLPAVGGPGKPRRQGARRRSPPRTSHRHAPCVRRCPINARLSDLALARPRLGLAASHNARTLMCNLGRAGHGRLGGSQASDTHPTSGLVGSAEATSPGQSGPSRPQIGQPEWRSACGCASHWLLDHPITRSPRPTRSPSGPSEGASTAPASSDAAREPARSAVSCSGRLSRRRLPRPGD